MNFMKKALVGGGALIIAVGVGVVAPGYLGLTNTSGYFVKLVPQKSSGEMKVDKKNQCKKGKHKGCLLFRENTSGQITFYLVGSRYGSKTCSNAKKVITKIEVTTTGEGGDPEAVKGDYDRTNPLPSWVRNDAFGSVDEATGIVYEAVSGHAFTQVSLINRNSHDAKDGERQFWYRVTATDCIAPVNIWIADPRGDNQGTRF
jgi:hypothetical protein